MYAKHGFQCDLLLKSDLMCKTNVKALKVKKMLMMQNCPEILRTSESLQVKRCSSLKKQK